MPAIELPSARKVERQLLVAKLDHLLEGAIDLGHLVRVLVVLVCKILRAHNVAFISISCRRR